MYVVICEATDIETGPFDTRAEADTWAEWGHCCPTGHTVMEVVNA